MKRVWEPLPGFPNARFLPIIPAIHIFGQCKRAAEIFRCPLFSPHINLNGPMGHKLWHGLPVSRIAQTVRDVGVLFVALADGISGSCFWGSLLALLGAFFMSVYTLLGFVCRKGISITIYTCLVYWAMVGTVVFCALLGRSVFN